MPCARVTPRYHNGGKAVVAASGQWRRRRVRESEETMKSITMQVDDEALERACRLAEARGVKLDDLIRAFLKRLGEPGMRDEPELEDQILAGIMEERARRWQGPSE